MLEVKASNPGVFTERDAPSPSPRWPLLLTEDLKRRFKAYSLLAADSGARHALLLGRSLERWLGDFDSEENLPLKVPKELPYYGPMDRKAWVMRAVEALRFAEFRDIQRYLDEEGESFSKKELEDTLKALLEEGQLEEKGGSTAPPAKRGGGRSSKTSLGTSYLE